MAAAPVGDPAAVQAALARVGAEPRAAVRQAQGPADQPATRPTQQPVAAGSPQQPTGGMNPNSAVGGAVTPPIVPPGTTGSGGNPVSSSSGVPRQGPGAAGSTGNQTGLGNIGPETEKEQRAQEQSDKATKSICDRC